MEIYATIGMGFGIVNLYPEMDTLLEGIGENTENNMVAYLSARVKHLKSKQSHVCGALAALVENAECRGDEDCDHCVAVQALSEYA